MLQGLMSLLVGQGSERKLRKTGPRREANLEMLIQVDPQMRQGTGWSLKRFQASHRLGQSDSSEQEAYLARLLGPGVCGMMLRTITPDPMHRITNNVKLADNASNLNVLRLEYATVLSLRVGPFVKQKHHGVVKQATKEFFKKVDASNSIFVYLYDRICVEAGWRTEPGYGDMDHYKKVWERLERLMCSAPTLCKDHCSNSCPDNTSQPEQNRKPCTWGNECIGAIGPKSNDVLGCPHALAIVRGV